MQRRVRSRRRPAVLIPALRLALSAGVVRASDIGENEELASRYPEKLEELEADEAAWNANNVEARWERGNRTARDAWKAAAASKGRCPTGIPDRP